MLKRLTKMLSTYTIHGMPIRSQMAHSDATEMDMVQNTAARRDVRAASRLYR